jgi:hypothetical protein
MPGVGPLSRRRVDTLSHCLKEKFMSYSNTYEILDLVGGFPQQAVRLWFVLTKAGGPTEVDNQQEADRLIQPDSTGPATRTFTSLRDLTPPAPHWDFALSIQDNPGVASDEGWIFRSGRFVALPVDSIEVILAPEEFLNQANIDAGLPSVPLVSGTTTITSIAAMITRTGLALTATGTDSRASGVTFTYTATLNLFPNSSISETDEPLNIGLAGPSLSFAGGGIGGQIIASVLNVVSGIILRDVSPRIRNTLKTRINSSIISTVASRLARQPTTSLPPGVIMSLRRVRFITRPTTSGTEPVVAILGAVGAFGGVLNKFPPPPGGRICFIATAAAGSNALEVQILSEFRDNHLLQNQVGRMIVRVYEFLSPPLARTIVRSMFARNITRRLIVEPAAFLVQQYTKVVKARKSPL